MVIFYNLRWFDIGLIFWSLEKAQLWKKAGPDIILNVDI